MLKGPLFRARRVVRARPKSFLPPLPAIYKRKRELAPPLRSSLVFIWNSGSFAKGASALGSRGQRSKNPCFAISLSLLLLLVGFRLKCQPSSYRFLSVGVAKHIIQKVAMSATLARRGLINFGSVR